MSDFRILQNLSKGALRYVSDAVDTHMLDDVAHIAASRTKGVTNPLYVATFGKIKAPGFGADIWSKTTGRVLRGDGASALDDAVRSLHQLGAKHAVSGINLSSNPAQYGAIRFADQSYYISGRPVIDRIGRGAAFEIDAAARRVMDFVEASHVA